MSFLHWWAIGVGAVAVAGPLAVHFLTRPKPISHPLSTLRFLREIIEQKKTRNRIRDFLVLLLRILAVALLAAAIGRPSWQSKEKKELSPDGSKRRVLLIDVSKSMGTQEGGVSALNRAKAAAQSLLEYNPNAQYAVLFAGAKTTSVFPRFSSNLVSLRQAIESAQPLAQRCDVQTAMESAGRLISSVANSECEFIVISDFQRSDWSNLYLDKIPEKTKSVFRSVALDTPSNLGVTGSRLQKSLIVDQEVVLEVDVGNFTDQEIEAVCTVNLKGKSGEKLFTLEGKAAAQTTTTLTIPVSFTDAGWYRGWIQLQKTADALLEDDKRPIAFEVLPSPKVLLISQQRKVNAPLSSFYLEEAINISLGSDSQGQQIASEKPTRAVNRIQTRELGNNPLPDADVYVLNQPGTIESQYVQQIGERVRRGKGLLFVVSGQVDGANLAQFANVFGKGFQPPVAFNVGVERKNLFIRTLNPRQAPFQIFGEEAYSATQTVRISGGLSTTIEAEGLRDQIQAELSDSSALLYLTTCDAGQVAVLNCDLDQSNWCVEPSFLPVVSETLQVLLAGNTKSNDVSAGVPLVRTITGSVQPNSKLQVRQGDDESATPEATGTWEWSVGQQAMVWSWNDPAGPGLYEAVSENQETVSIVATAAPASESELRSLDASLLQNRIAKGRTIAVSSVDTEEATEDSWWNWLIIACVLGLASEIAALRWFRA